MPIDTKSFRKGCVSHAWKHYHAVQQPFLLLFSTSLLWLGRLIFVPDGTADFPFAKLSSARSDFLLTNLYTSDNTLKKADSTFVESRAEVSRKNNPCFSANSFASSVRTWRKLLRSDLFPTNIIVMLVSECDFSSSSHLCVCSNETRLVMSYTSMAPTAPL